MAKVAVVQAASVLFDGAGSVRKAVGLIEEAAGNGAALVLFPEAFVPAYPRGFTFGMVVGSRTEAGRQLWQRYYENAIAVPSPESAQLAAAAREAGVHVAIGVIERAGGTLYCTLLLFGPDGQLLHKHRKLKPTGAERLIWGEGDGRSLRVVETPLGNMGGLICWENYMPLARTALYEQQVQIYLAPTADSRDTWQATLQHIALEGRCFVLGCNQFVTKEMVPVDLPGIEELAGLPEVLCRGGSTIVSPLGEVLAGPLYDAEGILYADLDMDAVVRSKLDFDVVGHYARPDVLRLDYRPAWKE
jgi:nitrilase